MEAPAERMRGGRRGANQQGGWLRGTAQHVRRSIRAGDSLEEQGEGIGEKRKVGETEIRLAEDECARGERDEERRERTDETCDRHPIR